MHVMVRIACALWQERMKIGVTGGSRVGNKKLLEEKNEKKNTGYRNGISNGSWNFSRNNSGGSNRRKKVVIKLGHVEPEDRSTHKATVKFKQYVEEQSEGKIAVEIYPNGQLGGDRQETEAVALGTLQITIPATSVLTTYNPKFGILDMPFIFQGCQISFRGVGWRGWKDFGCLFDPGGLKESWIRL